MPGLLGCARGNRSMFLSLCFSLPSLSKKINKILKSPQIKNIQGSQPTNLPTNRLFFVCVFHPSYHSTSPSLPAKWLEREPHTCSLSHLPFALQPCSGGFPPFSMETTLSGVISQSLVPKWNSLPNPSLSSVLCDIFFKSSPEDLLIDFRDGGRERERETFMQEKHWSIASHMCPDREPNLGMCPDHGSNLYGRTLPPTEPPCQGSALPYLTLVLLLGIMQSPQVCRGRKSCWAPKLLSNGLILKIRKWRSREAQWVDLY